MKEHITHVQILIAYLQNYIEADPHWVTISHLVNFHLSEENDWDPLKARVFVDFCNPSSEGLAQFKIRYRITRAFIDWSQLEELKVIGIPETALEIEKILKIAAYNLPGRNEISVDDGLK